jgi:hypothetical protein
MFDAVPIFYGVHIETGVLIDRVLSEVPCTINEKHGAGNGLLLTKSSK